MDNRRNSGAYSSRTTDPPQQPPSVGQSQKRASYRRPVESQPTPAPAQTSVPSNAVPSNSARPVAAAPVSNSVSRASSHRRRQSQHIPPTAAGQAHALMPAAPDVPRGPPPSAYRDPYAPKGSSRSRGPARNYAGQSRNPAIQSNASRQQPSIQTAPNRLHELRSPPYAPAESMSGTLDGAKWDPHRRPSVPERSPLQKLEGKLDDISKEEKRARILEIELAAQEKAEAEMRARRARDAAAKQQRVASGPVSSPGRSGTASNRTGGARRHVSMPVQPKSNPKSPELGEMDGSNDGVGRDTSEPWDPTGRTVPAPQRAQSKEQRLSSGSQRQPNRLSYDDEHAAPTRIPSVKGKEPIGAARGNGSFRDRTGAARGSNGAQGSAQRNEGKPTQGKSSTGLGLFEVEDAPRASRSPGDNVSRYDSKKLSKDLPPSPRESTNANGKSRDSRGILAAQQQMEQQRLSQHQGTKGFDYLQPQPHDPSASGSAMQSGTGFAPSGSESQSNTSQESHVRQPDVFSHQKPDRRYIAPPMLEEWRDSSLGTLLAGDLNLDAPDRSSSGSKHAWWEESQSSHRRRSGSHAETSYDGFGDEPTGQTSFNPSLYLKCGPLLRYTGMRRDKSSVGKEREIWRGSVMIVTIDEQSSYQKPPVLRMFKQPMDLLPPPPAEVDTDDFDPAYVDPIEGQIKVSRSGKTLYVKPIDEIDEKEDLSRVEDDSGLFQMTRITPHSTGQKTSRIQKKDGEKIGKMRDVPGVRLHAERGVTFWRFNLEIELGSQQARIAYRINRGPAIGFWVPAKGETMNIMFHSCNGFSLSVDSNEFCGPDPMWRDVLNNHQTRPFHVMIGGGDQIYNDAVMSETRLFKQWTESRNPLQKHNASFSTELQNELEQFYLDRYSMWFSQGMFGMATSQIPMVNIWDDHDIIDGFGSYPHHFMSTPVFTGLGAVAFKYYMLFQHQSVPAETEKTEPSWLLGAHQGPYIREQSRSVFMQLGRQVAFLGLDCRTERQRSEILTEDSYDVIFDRLEKEIIKGETKHLLVLLGVPIAYPRLNFLENVLTSRLMDPIKALGRVGLLGNLVNKFDGGVEILDDLDDHWTAKHHKDERNWLIRELQHIASTKSVRITILGGDVHLAAIGQFFTNKKFNISKDKDHRYMPNVVSSAIVNTPPPEMMADIINKRNKIHHLDPNTDENMIPIFTHDSNGKKRNNVHLLPRRNWCSLREYKPGTTPTGTPSPPASPGADGPRLTRTLSDYTPGKMVRRLSGTENGSRGRNRQSGPPVAYYNNPSYAAAAAAAPQSSFSPDREERPRTRRNSLTSLFRRRASVDSVNPPGSPQSMPPPQNRDSIASSARPSTFHRRASILGKKGVKQGGDYINLRGGLDICLNLEVSQKDPAGITTPYRLLVPALDYTPPETGVVEKERQKSRGVFGVFGKKKRTVGDDGYSRSGSDTSESESEASESEDEERARNRYKVGPRILIPGISKKRNSGSGGYANPPAAAGQDMRNLQPPSPNGNSKQRQSMDVSASRAVQHDRHSSAPGPTAAPTTSSVPPTRSVSSRHSNLNSSHQSQLPVPASEAKVNRRSMGGILNQHRGAHFEHDAHVATHTPATPTARSRRESYPPHPAIVGTGPNSPYGRGTLEARNDTGSYFSSKNGSGGAAGGVVVPEPNAGVGARYLGGGRYADEDASVSDLSDSEAEGGGGGGGGGGGRREMRDDDESYSDESTPSQDSFVLPKKTAKWKIWK